jgi:hypothetical protein
MKIDKKIPIPDFRKRSDYWTIIAKMKVGDSVFFNDRKEANRFYGCCHNSFRKWEFTLRTFNNGTRIWRTS